MKNGICSNYDVEVTDTNYCQAGGIYDKHYCYECPNFIPEVDNDTEFGVDNQHADYGVE